MAPLLELLTAGERALESHDLDAALSSFSAAHALVPSDPSLGLALANVYRLRGESSAQRTVLLDTFRAGEWSTVEIAHALGAALLSVGAAPQATACFVHVAATRPRDPAALSALASAKRASGDADGAWPIVKRALELAPREASLCLTAAQVRHDLGDLLGALKWLDKAEKLRPRHAPTRVQRAYSMMLRAPSAEGWAQFEHRPLPAPTSDAKAWKGEPFDGRSVLVMAEQGIGDFLQFLRFVSLLQDRGAGRVVVECHPSLITLLQGNGFDVVARGTPVETDLYVPLLSLPHVLKLGAKVAADAVPYLRAIPVANDLGLPPADGRRRLGLVWAGNPVFTQRVVRDLDPTLLPTLTSIEGVQWIPLQQGEAGDLEIPGVAPRVVLTDWSQTAAALSQLDGLVSTDTGIVHLAGAMGVPTWLLLHKVPDWRWGLNGDTTRWYPSVRVVRQPLAGDWSGLVARLHQALVDE